MKHPILSKEYLESYDPGIADFRAWCKLFPDGMELTDSNWQKIVGSGIDYTWLRNLLTGSALIEFNKITALAWAEYDKITALALLVALRKSIKE